jgi:transmembrane sensor
MSIDRFWILIARKLSGEASIEELQELEALLRSHTDLHFSVEIITNLWNQRSIPDEVQLEDSYKIHINKLKNLGISVQHEEVIEDSEMPYLLEGSRKSARVKKFLLASVLLILFIGGYYILMPSKKVPLPTADEAGMAVTTKFGSRTNLQLPDGSKVWLNSGSTLTYDKEFGKKIREVVLSGEAFFDVVKNTEKPFIIHTTSMDIKVLGTQFNVKTYANDKISEASLIHGSLEVSLKKRGFEKILLQPNEKIVVMNEGPKENTAAVARKMPTESIMAVQKLNYAENDSTIIETSWVDNKLIFRDESFEEIAVRMERWYGIPVTFQDPSIKSMRFTGIFTNETIEQALEALQITSRFHYTIKDNTITLTK